MYRIEQLKNNLLFLFLLLLPTQLGKHFFFDFSYLSGVRIDYLSPTVYVTDILVVLLACLAWRHLWEFGKKYAKPIGIVSFFVILNILFSLSPFLALYKTVKYLELVIVFVLLQQAQLSAKHIVLAFTLGSSVELLLGTLQLTQGHAMQGIFYWIGERYFSLSTPDIAKVSLNGVEVLRAYASFSHPNSLAGFYLLLYFFVVLYKPFVKYRVLKAICIITSTLLIFISFSKFAIATFLLMNIIYFVYRRREIGCIFCIFARVFGLLVLAFIFTSGKGDPDSLQKRWELIKNAVMIIIQHPLFGVGIGNYLVAQQHFPNHYSYYFMQPVHNILLLFISEAGIIFTGLVGYGLFLWLKRKKKDKNLFFTLGIFVITGMFDHYWLTLQQNMLLLPTVFALLNRRNDKEV